MSLIRLESVLSQVEYSEVLLFDMIKKFVNTGAMYVGES